MPAPGRSHLRAVAQSIFDEFNAESRMFFEDAGDVVDRLASTTPRRMRRAVEAAMACAAASGRRDLRPDDVVVDEGRNRPRIGFRSVP